MIESVMKNLLIHTCCADCLLNTFTDLDTRKLIDSESKVTLLFYNPNIHPRAEYLERLRAVQKILPQIKEKWNANLVIPDYSPKEYIDEVVKGSTKIGDRCNICWKIRLGYSLRYAKENGYENITTTLLTSHYQQADIILEILNDFSKEYGINIVEVSEVFNKKHTGFYKQNYCGCCFSLTEKMIKKGR